MKKILRIGTLVLLVLITTSWASLKVDAVQEWCKSKVRSAIREASGIDVSIGSFHGAPPFILGCDEIKVDVPDVGSITVDSLTVVPSWLEMMFGRIAFLYASAHTIDLTQVDPNSKSEDLPPSIRVHSFRLSDIALPRKYYEPLLNEYANQSNATCLFSMQGSLSWDASTKECKTNLNITPYAGSVQFASCDLKIHANAGLTSIKAKIDANKAPSGSIFFSLPCDHARLQVDCLADAPHSLFTGSWSLSGAKAEQVPSGLNPLVRFAVSGTCKAQDPSHFSFTTSQMSCQRITPADISTIHSDDPEGIQTTLATISDIPMPKSIEGSITQDEQGFECLLQALQVDLGDYKMPACALRVRLAPESGSLSAECRLQHAHFDLPLSLSSEFASLQPGVWYFPKVTLQAADHAIEGPLRLSLFPFSLHGQLESVDTKAQGFSTCFHASMESLFCRLAFDAQEEEQKMHLVIEADKTRYKDLFCARAKLSATSMSITFHALGIEARSLHVKRLQASCTIDSTSYPFTLSLEGRTKNGPCLLDTSGSIGNGYFFVDSFRAVVGEHTIKNSGALSIIKRASVMQIEPFAFTSDGNTLLAGSGSFSDKSLEAHITCENFPIECLDPFIYELELFGPVSGQFELSGTTRKPSLFCTLASSDLQFKNSRVKLAASCQVTVRDGLIHALSEVTGLHLQTPTLLELELPIEIHHTPFSVSLSESKPLAGRFQAEFALGQLLAPYLEEEELLEGCISVDATLVGSSSQPLLTGSARLCEGNIYIPILGTTFSNIQMQGHIQDNQCMIEAISATDDANGQLVGSGWVRDILSDTFRYHLESEISSFATIALDEASATTSGKLTLDGNSDAATLNASLEVTDAELTLSPMISKDIPSLDITYVGLPENLELQRKTPFLFSVDLDFSMPKGIVRGMGLESEWKGDVHVKGEANQIDVTGKILLTSGTLVFAKKTFELTHGSLEFHGDPYKKSQLQVIASNDMGSICTQVALQGPLENPRIVLQSNPAMTQKEILSRLLFNKNSSEITPMEGLQLGQILLQLRGTSTGFDIVEDIKQTLHIDKIDFGPSTSARPQVNAPGSSKEGTSDSPGAQDSIPNEVSVQVGKYISEGVMVTLSKDVTNEVNRVGVEATLSNHITAQANVGDDAQAELSLEWKVRY